MDYQGRHFRELGDDERKGWLEVHVPNFTQAAKDDTDAFKVVLSVLGFLCPGATATVLAFMGASDPEVAAQLRWPLACFAGATLAFLVGVIRDAARTEQNTRKFTNAYNRTVENEITLKEHDNLVDELNRPPRVSSLAMVSWLPTLLLAAGTILTARAVWSGA